MKIIVIGGQGFIGSHIVERGREIGHEMVSMDNEPGADIRLTASQVSYDRIEGAERIIWAAGVLGTAETFDSPQQTAQANIMDALVALDMCRVHDIPFTHITLGNKWLNPYSITKNCTSEFCRMYSDRYSIKTQVAVTYNVFGPRQKWEPVRKIVPYFMRQLIKEEPIELFGEGRNSVDMVYVKDFANAIIRSDNGGTVHYGTGKSMTAVGVAHACASALGVTTPRFIKAGTRPGETGLGAVAPYQMPYPLTPFREALAETAQWYKENIK